MKYIRLEKCEDGVIWVTSDEDWNGIELAFEEGGDESSQMLIALAEFLGFDSDKVLNLDEETDDYEG